MTGRRWWDVFFTATIVMLAAINAIAWVPSTGQRVGVWVILGVFSVAYFTIGRRALRGEARFALPFSIVVIIASGAVVACSPNAAVIQAISFPMLWSMIERTRYAVIANVALALAVSAGFVICLGTDADDLIQTAIIESISLVGSLALGIWMSRIAELSHERQLLLDQLTATQGQLALVNRDAGIASERERLAREIHDTIAQDLTGLVMLTQRAQRELGDSEAGTLALLEESARTALAETRALVASAAPVGLATGGIADALQRLGARFGRETGVIVSVEAHDLPTLDRDAEVVLLRVAQEGLANVRKHAQAGAASVSAWADNGFVALRVTDDGTGFDPGAPTDGYGLGGMRERLALVGGSLDVSSSPAGTALTATMPVRA